MIASTGPLRERIKRALGTMRGANFSAIVCWSRLPDLTMADSDRLDAIYAPVAEARIKTQGQPGGGVRAHL